MPKSMFYGANERHQGYGYVTYVGDRQQIVTQERLTLRAVCVSRIHLSWYRLLMNWLHGCHHVTTSTNNTTAPHTSAHLSILTSFIYTQQYSPPLSYRVPYHHYCLAYSLMTKSQKRHSSVGCVRQ